MGQRDDSGERLKRIFRAEANLDIPALVEALHDPDYAHTAARSLAKRAEAVTNERDAAIRGLRRLLKARDPHARAAAAQALGGLVAREAAGELTDLAREDPVDWVRAWAVGALGGAGDESSHPVIVGFLEDPSYKVRRGATAALLTAGDPSAVPSLSRAMRRERWFRRAPFRDAIRGLQGVDG